MERFSNKLPDFCYAHHPLDGKPIRIFKGEDGYHPPAHKYADVDEINGLMGITYEQEAAMLFGSMYGWKTPAADPLHWEKSESFQRKLKKENKPTAAEMRARAKVEQREKESKKS